VKAVFWSALFWGQGVKSNDVLEVIKGIQRSKLDRGAERLLKRDVPEFAIVEGAMALEEFDAQT